MISDFFGVDPDGQPSVKGRIELQGGGQLLLRPLTLEKLFALMRVGLPDFSMEEISTMAPEKFLEVFAEQLAPALRIVLGDAAATVPAVNYAQVVTWYLGEHEWQRIYTGILNPDEGQTVTAESIDAILDLMFALEIATQGARPVERQLQMRPEAWISTLESFERRADRAKVGADAPSKKGELRVKGCSMDQVFAVMPGGETVNIRVDSDGNEVH